MQDFVVCEIPVVLVAEGNSVVVYLFANYHTSHAACFCPAKSFDSCCLAFARKRQTEQVHHHQEELQMDVELEHWDVQAILEHRVSSSIP